MKIIIYKTTNTRYYDVRNNGLILLFYTYIMYYSKIGNAGAGFTNQIFALITSIINAYQKGNKIVVVDDFLNDINNTTHTPISNIFNINKINTFLQQEYNIIILDKNNIQFEILSIKYGSKTKTIDLTDLFKKQYLNNKKLFISKNSCLNDIQGDPCPGIVKEFIMTYKINNYICENKYNENLKTDININFDGPYKFTFGWITPFNDNMFEKILKNITYNHEFILKSELAIKEIDTEQKINVIHLRLEEDAIAHWSKQNNAIPNKYKEYLEKKYINIIQKYVTKTDENIILSSSLSNGVISFLNQHNYNYRFVDKCFSDREKNAIVDLLISKHCNNIFIGNFNINANNGSTFSYYIWQLLNENVIKIYIDLDKISDKEVVVNPAI